jgi:geranylgeranyl diphosphate synthase type II
MSVDIETYLRVQRDRIDRTLDAHLPPAATRPSTIHEAMRYAVLGGGKRIRPIIAIAAAEACGAASDPLLVPFAALELIHTYSLVHDDLPPLDNDDLRRGRKTTHIVFGEAMAILTGDALLTEAFSWLAQPVDGVDPLKQLQATGEVARAVDSTGMIGGQVADIEGERAQEKPHDHASLVEELEFIHRNKTGRLLTASVVLGGLLAGGSEDEIAALRRYGDATGHAFQIVDDLLDVEESAATLGKTAGKDLAQGKLTYPALFGIPAARAKAEELLQVALDNAGMMHGPVNYLAALARFICERRS